MFLSQRAQQWAKRFEQFSQDNVTIAQFCLREGVSQAAFYYWRRKLRETPAVSNQSLRPIELRENASRSQQIDRPHPPQFIPVSLPSSSTTNFPSPTAKSPSVMTVELPGGILVRFEIPLDPTQAVQREIGS